MYVAGYSVVLGLKLCFSINLQIEKLYYILLWTEMKTRVQATFM